MIRFLGMLVLVFGMQTVPAQNVTRLHSYGSANPDLVERQIRALVPEQPRVSMNRRARQVIVVAEESVQEKIAAMVAHLSRVPLELRFRIRHNREVREVAVPPGTPFSLPVSSTPSERLLALARSRLDPDRQQLPVVASALQLHATLLREDPPVVRLRATPAVVFGPLKPYTVVSFSELTQDLLMNTREFLDVPRELSSHDFYRNFFLTRDEVGARPKPVGILLSLEVGPVSSEAEEESGSEP